MPESRVTKGNRTTVPAEICTVLGLKPGTLIAWHVMPDNTVLVRAKSRPISDLAGMLKRPDVHVDVEDMNIGSSD